MKKSKNYLSEQIELLEGQVAKEGLSQAGALNISLKKETIQFVIPGKNKEIITSLFPQLPAPDPGEVHQLALKSEQTSPFQVSENCGIINTLLVSGEDATNAAGIYVLDVKEKICLEGHSVLKFYFVATPESDSPTVLNFTTDSASQKVTIKTVGLDGKPVKSDFQWHLMLHYESDIIIL